MEILEVTWKRVFQVWWAYLWRNVLITIFGMIAGMLIGFVIGCLGVALQIQPATLRPIIFIICFLIGLFLSAVPMKMILRKEFGEFKICLIRKGP